MAIPFAELSFPEIYERALVPPLFRPWVDPLLDDLALAPGNRVLDVACGTGIVARTARQRLGDASKVVGVDVSPAMLAVARQVAPEIDWRDGDATALPLEAGEQFDVVACQQGFQFFTDQAAAAGQLRRALASGGRLGVSTWRPDEEFPVLRQLRAVVERQLGPIADRRHALGDPAPLAALLESAGFRDVRTRTLTQTIRFEDGEVFVRLNAMALIGMSAGGRDLDPGERERVMAAIVADSAELVRRHTDARGFAYQIGTNVVTARG